MYRFVPIKYLGHEINHNILDGCKFINENVCQSLLLVYNVIVLTYSNSYLLVLYILID